MITYAEGLIQSEPTDTERRIQRALARHLDWRVNFCAFNSYLFQWEADLYALSKSGYLREYEIKVDWQDWVSDHLKDKFKTPRNVRHRMDYVKEFWYVVPATLYESKGLPPTLREEAGVLVVSAPNGFLRVKEVRPCKRNAKAQKLEHKHVVALYRSAYFKLLSKYVGDKKIPADDDPYFPANPLTHKTY